MADKTPAGIVLVSHDERLRVEFAWREDRFHHQVFLDDRAVIDSVEGSAEDPWPCSPPLQQLSLEQINGSPVVLGVGSAGRGHWSVSVEIDSASTSVKFDLACRCPAQPEFLGSTYRLLSDAVTLHPIDGVALGEAPLGAADQKNRVQRMVAQATPGQAGTVCWSYQVAAKQPQ